MGERGDVTCSKGPGFEPQLAAYVYVLNFAMPWPPHTSFVSHLGHPSKNVLDTPLREWEGFGSVDLNTCIEYMM